MEYTKRRNLNRGCMKLEVWQRGLDLFALAFRLAAPISDFKLKRENHSWQATLPQAQ